MIRQFMAACYATHNHIDERMQGTNWLEEKSTILKSIKAKEEKLKDYEKVSSAVNMLLDKYL